MNRAEGWHTRGYLPHFDSAEAIQFVTLCLVDSLPRGGAVDLALREEGVYLIDCELDAGLGVCWRRRDDIASTVEESLLHFDGARYRMLARCLMPNHVHVVIEPLSGYPLGGIVRSWKTFTARRANALLERTGAFWYEDYFDRFMRDEITLPGPSTMWRKTL
jgi:putative transposase